MKPATDNKVSRANKGEVARFQHNRKEDEKGFEKLLINNKKIKKSFDLSIIGRKYVFRYIYQYGKGILTVTPARFTSFCGTALTSTQ